MNVAKGLANLIAVSKKREDDAHLLLEKVEEIKVHKICRREYIKERNIERDRKESSAESSVRQLKNSATCS